MSDLTLAQQLGRFAAETTYESLPAEVAASVTSRVLDILGICAAASPLETSDAARAWVAEQGGSPQASAIGMLERVTASQAAFVNGVLAHSLDYDDTHLPSVLHPSASVIPAVLAAAQHNGSSGREVIAAIAVGLEVCIRLGMAGYDREAKNSVFFEHGQHATSICGAMGSAAAVASLLGDAALVTNSLGIAASMASGIIEANRTGGTVKRLHCGWAAKSGIDAVGLVRHGFTGPPTVIEGRFGFLQAWLHGNFDTAEVTEGLGSTWSIEDIFFKPYPANHFTHAAVDAGAALRRSGIRPDDIVSIELGVPAPNLRTIGEPIERKRTPETGYEAQFSGPYAVAAGLIGGSGLEVGLDDYSDELARDPLRRSIMAKVTVVPDDECTAIFPQQFPVTLTATLADGRVVTERVHSNRGGPDRPLHFDELTRKFRDNAKRTLRNAAIDDLESECRRLATLDTVDVLFWHLTALESTALDSRATSAVTTV